jgi:hypothetical protein
MPPERLFATWPLIRTACDLRESGRHIGENRGPFGREWLDFLQLWSETTLDLSQTGHVGYAECVTVQAMQVASADTRRIPPAGRGSRGRPRNRIQPTH